MVCCGARYARGELMLVTDTHAPEWTVGDRVRKARETAGLTMEQLGEAIGVGRASIAAYEHGERAPRRAVLMAVAMRCGVPVWCLIGEAEPAIRSRCFAAGSSWSRCAA